MVCTNTTNGLRGGRRGAVEGGIAIHYLYIRFHLLLNQLDKDHKQSLMLLQVALNRCTGCPDNMAGNFPHMHLGPPRKMCRYNHSYIHMKVY